MSSIRITDLPKSTLPYSGNEDLLIVQNGFTTTNSLCSLTNYLSESLIPDNGITNDKLANMAEATFKGRLSGGIGDPQDLSVPQVQSLVVTSSAVQAAITDATTTQAADMRVDLEAQSASIGFLDQFENSTRYPDPTSIVSNTTAPEIGSAWRIHVPGGTAPTVTARSLTPHTDSLFYIGSSVPSRGKKFSLAFEFTAAEGSALWSNRMGLNISFNAAEMIPADGSTIYPSAGGGVVHINFSDTGITTAASPQFFGGASLTCLNATVSGGIYEWFPGYSGMVAGQRYTILYEVEGNYLRITLVGVGSLLFYHPNLSDHVGTENTNFWWEPNGGTYGSDYRIVPLLHRVWSGPQLNELPSWGSKPPGGITEQYYFYKGRLRVMGQGIGQTFANGNTPTSADNYFLATPGAVRADLGFFTRPAAGTADYPLEFSSDLISTEVSCAAGADQTLAAMSIFDFAWANGKGIEYVIYGVTAANSNNKRIKLRNFAFGDIAGLGVGVVFDSGDFTDNAKPFRLKIRKRRITSHGHVWFFEWKVGSGTSVISHALNVSQAGTAASLTFLTGSATLPATAAGDLKFYDGHSRALFH